jgi:hypothetical protein
MSHTTKAIIVIAVFVLIIIVSFLVHYFNILVREDNAAGQALDPDDPYGGDYRDPDDDYPPTMEIQEAAEVNALHFPAADAGPEDDYPSGVEDAPDPAFVFKFAAYYIEEKTHIENSRMRSFAPRLFSDTWYDDTRRAFSEWAVDLRERYQLAS